MQQADAFVILLHCQFNREVYQHRLKLKDEWHTMSVKRGSHLDTIAQKRYADPFKDWERIKLQLRRYQSFLSTFDDLITPILSSTNIAIIYKLMARLDIRTPIYFDTPTALTATDRLVDICKKHSATTYLAGPSGQHYMDLSKFEAAGIKVRFQETKGLDRRHAFEKLCA
jgi:hypothetical protein